MVRRGALSKFPVCGINMSTPPDKITQCQSMLRYLGIDKFLCKIHYYDSNTEFPCSRHVFTFNSCGTIDYDGYVDKWSVNPVKHLKNVGGCASSQTNETILDTIHNKLQQKSMDKARHQAMQKYLNRQLCIGGLGFLIETQ